MGEALGALTAQYPNLRQHLYGEDGKLRSFVNVYLNDEDVRYLKYVETPLKESDKLAIVPSVAGGVNGWAANQRMTTNQQRIVREEIMAERKVDHSALRTNQAFIIGLLVIAFVLDAKWLVALVSAVMLIGTVFPKVGAVQSRVLVSS